MIHVYLLSSTRPMRVKIGIGRVLKKRTRQVDRTTPGRQRVVFSVLMPVWGRWLERWLHHRYRRYRSPLRYGSGRTEYFRPGLWVVGCLAWMLVWWLLAWFTLFVLAGAGTWVLINLESVLKNT